MNKVKELVDKINEEVEGAKEYAECYIDAKSRNDSAWVTRYREMAQDELKHSSYLHEKAVAMVERLKQVYTPPVEMEEAWSKSHKLYIENITRVKTMLSM